MCMYTWCMAWLFITDFLNEKVMQKQGRRMAVSITVVEELPTLSSQTTAP